MHRRWFEKFLPKESVIYKNRSDDFHGIAISGPNSRKLLSRICRNDVSAEALKFRDVRETFVGGVPAILNRISFFWRIRIRNLRCSTVSIKII